MADHNNNNNNEPSSTSTDHKQVSFSDSIIVFDHAADDEYEPTPGLQEELDESDSILSFRQVSTETSNKNASSTQSISKGSISNSKRNIDINHGNAVNEIPVVPSYPAQEVYKQEDFDLYDDDVVKKREEIKAKISLYIFYNVFVCVCVVPSSLSLKTTTR